MVKTSSDGTATLTIDQLRALIPQLEEIGELCRRYPVQRLAVFGSAVRDDFNFERSDVDFLVEFAPTSPAEHADAYFGLLAELEALFGRHVGLVESAALRNPYRRREIEATQLVLHVAA